VYKSTNKDRIICLGILNFQEKILYLNKFYNISYNTESCIAHANLIVHCKIWSSHKMPQVFFKWGNTPRPLHQNNGHSHKMLKLWSKYLACLRALISQVIMPGILYLCPFITWIELFLPATCFSVFYFSIFAGNLENSQNINVRASVGPIYDVSNYFYKFFFLLLSNKTDCMSLLWKWVPMFKCFVCGLAVKDIIII
jgi:hypothetical protein